MKFSKFNSIIKNGNEPYIWNTKSNAVSKLDDPMRATHSVDAEI